MNHVKFHQIFYRQSCYPIECESHGHNPRGDQVDPSEKLGPVASQVLQVQKLAWKKGLGQKSWLSLLRHLLYFCLSTHPPQNLKLFDQLWTEVVDVVPQMKILNLLPVLPGERPHALLLDAQLVEVRGEKSQPYG